MKNNPSIEGETWLPARYVSSSLAKQEKRLADRFCEHLRAEAEEGLFLKSQNYCQIRKKTVLKGTKLLGARKYFSKPENLFQPNIYFLVHKSFFKSKKISQIRKSLVKSRKVF